MQPEPQSGPNPNPHSNPSPALTQKSRSILYHLKQSLHSHNLLLETHISNIFAYRKQKFNRKQFHKLIRKYDEYLVLAQIDQVFRELDSQGRKFVDLEILEIAIGDVGEKDDPAFFLNRRSVMLTDSQDIRENRALIELKDVLVQNDNYLETIQLFMTETDGYLTRTNLKSLLTNLHITDPKKTSLILQACFDNDTDKISLQDFLEKLDLNHNGTRINLSDFSLQESIILEMRKSQYVQKLENSRLSRMSQEINEEYSRILDGLLAEDNSTFKSGYFVIEKIPKPLQPYFNYGSELEEPFANLAQHYIINNEIYVDQEGPTYGKAVVWIHILQRIPNYFLFQAAQSIVYRAQQRKGLGMLLEPKDITQGKFGNCYFLSAVAAIVEAYPELVYRLFVLEKNPSHIYGVRLFVDGIWVTIAVDCCFPLNDKNKFCGAQPHHSEIWVMLLEKAWAKLFGSYENIHSGYNEQGLVAISGAPTLILLINQPNFLQKIQQEFKKGSIITCTTAKHISQLTEQAQDKLGVYAGHAYTILKIYYDVPIQEGKKQITLIKMKNPWGAKAWKGDWSFGSKKWNKMLRDLMNYNFDSKDGTFFISLDDFVKYFDHINICKVSLGNRNSYITNLANRYDFYSNRIKISQAGTYFFTVYQQNSRKHKSFGGVFQKSPSWLFLAALEKGEQGIGVQAVACNASGYQNSTVQGWLEPGEYLIMSRVSWNYWDQRHYVISSYGPGKVQFEPSQIAPTELLNLFITSKALQTLSQNTPKLTYYKDTNIWKYFYFEHTEGLGFISVGNNTALSKGEDKENYIIQPEYTLNPCKGIQVLEPFKSKIVMRVQRGQTAVACFLVDPQGYSYKLMEGYKLFVVKTVE